jgi:conflict system pore-forming effector with SLATT domain
MVEQGLTDRDLPGLFQGADLASVEGQRRHIRGVRLRLTFAIIAAGTGITSLRVGASGIDLLSIGTVIALVVVVSVEFYLKAVRPEDTWYDGRALAESAKSLSWRYAVGAVPFPKGGANAGPEYVTRLEMLLHDAPTTSIKPTSAPAVTPAMLALRDSSLAVRREVYLRDRIAEQQSWYANKAGQTGNLAHRWEVILLTVEITGILAALFRVVGLVDFDLAGVVAAFIGAGAAWLAVRQYATNARAYTSPTNASATSTTRTRGRRRWPTPRKR